MEEEIQPVAWNKVLNSIRFYPTITTSFTPPSIHIRVGFLRHLQAFALAWTLVPLRAASLFCLNSEHHVDFCQSLTPNHSKPHWSKSFLQSRNLKEKKKRRLLQVIRKLQLSGTVGVRRRYEKNDGIWTRFLDMFCGQKMTFHKDKEGSWDMVFLEYFIYKFTKKNTRDVGIVKHGGGCIMVSSPSLQASIAASVVFPPPSSHSRPGAQPAHFPPGLLQRPPFWFTTQKNVENPAGRMIPQTRHPSNTSHLFPHI